MIHDIAIQVWPSWRRMAFMAALSLLAGLSAEPYVTQLMSVVAMSTKQGEN